MPDKINFLFNEISKNYDFMNNIMSLGTHKIIKALAIKSLNIKPKSKVLDLCCGTGDFGAIVKKLYPDCDVIGVDFSEKMLNIAEKNNKTITYRIADATKLPFEKNSFDYVVMGFGLRNIPEKNKAIEEIYRVLKTNGEFLHLDFGEHNFASRIFDIFILFTAKLFLKNTKPYKYLILSKRNFLTPDELIELFKFNRFKYQRHKKLIFGIISYQIMKKESL